VENSILENKVYNNPDSILRANSLNSEKSQRTNIKLFQIFLSCLPNSITKE